MSSFNKKGWRSFKIKKDKLTKKHVKEFNSILSSISEIAPKLIHKYPDVEFTEDNLNDYILEFYHRELDAMEKFILLGKLHYGENNIK